MNFPIITSAQMADVDKIAVKQGLMIIQMMEYAGLNIARFIQGFIQEKTPGKVLILAGKGHNGGDGIAAARHLVNWGIETNILLAELPENLKTTSVHHLSLVKKNNIYAEIWNNTKEQKQLFQEADVIVDSLLGYNINGNPRERYKALIIEANNANKPIIAIDLPSGLDGTTGAPNAPTIKANQTLTLALPKIGLTKKSATEYVGEVFVADLGITESIFSEAGIQVPKGLFKTNSIGKLSLS